MAGVPRLDVVPLTSIVGTIEPTIHFDARFRPGSEVLRHRWERVALAHRRGDPLPPISVLARGEGYYVCTAATGSRWRERSGTRTSTPG